MMDRKRERERELAAKRVTTIVSDSRVSPETSAMQLLGASDLMRNDTTCAFCFTSSIVGKNQSL